MLTWLVQRADLTVAEHEGASAYVTDGALVIEDADELLVCRYAAGEWRSVHLRNPAAAPVVVVR